MAFTRARWRGVAALIGVALALGGCDNIREQLGLGKNPPDEFRVVSRAPLDIPEHKQLVPPMPGTTRPQEGTPRQQARQALLAGESGSPGPQAQAARPFTAGEQALLARAGADEAPDDIRQVVDRETEQLNEDATTFVDTLIFWREKEGPEKVVDAQAEAKRLRENAALGEDVTKGETPTIERKERGLLEGVFN